MNRPRLAVPNVGLAVPTDLVGVLAVVVLANVTVFVGIPFEAVVQPVLGLVFVLFVPGYALVAVLFPEAGVSPTVARQSEASGRGVRNRAQDIVTRTRGIDRLERVGLAVGLSLAVVPLLGLVVTLSPVTFGTESVFAALSLWTAGCVLFASRRRHTLPVENRYRSPVASWLGSIAGGFSGGSRRHLVVNTVLVLAVVFAVGALGVAMLSPADGESYTDFYVLTENESGDLTAASYPDSMPPGEPTPLQVGIENYEDEPTTYEVVTQLQRVNRSGQDLTVTERAEVDRFSTTLAPGERYLAEREIVPSGEFSGTELRLTFLLYTGDAPPTPTKETAYRELHIWVDVPAFTV